MLSALSRPAIRSICLSRQFSTLQLQGVKAYLDHTSVPESTRALWNAYRTAQSTLSDASQEVARSNDVEMRDLFAASLPELQSDVHLAQEALTQALIGPLLPGCTGVIIEVLAQRAGSDGADFTAWLKRMWMGLAESQGWSVSVLDYDYCKITLPKPLAGGGEGYRHLILQITGSSSKGNSRDHIWDYLRFERGLHRLTVMSAKGPIQSTDVQVLVSGFCAITARLLPYKLTSIHQVFPIAASPQGEENQGLLYTSSELRIDTLRSSGPGGQHVNKTESAVRVTHLPSSISVLSQSSRSQSDNKEKALEQLQARLLARQLEEREEAERTARHEASQQDKARTYQFHKVCAQLLLRSTAEKQAAQPADCCLVA